MENLKVCVDLSNAFGDQLFGLYNAFKERDENVINEEYKRIIGSDALTEQFLIDAKKHKDFDTLLSINTDSRNKLLELALQKSKLWANGRKLNVKFLGGNGFVQEKVIHFAKQWENYANIQFNFIDTGDAEIRVAFFSGKGSWSYIGTDALNITDQSQPTMNFGWFDDQTTDAEFSRTTIHEFGHCLGCIHEHQSPAATIKWNKQEVYDFYATTQTPPWDRAKVDANIFAKYGWGEITNSVFDPKSIMLYPIPKNFTTNGFSVGMNNLLSSEDIRFISGCYPKP